MFALPDADGSLLLATRVDAVFFLLPLLTKNGSRYSPLSQYLVSSGPESLSLDRLKSLVGVHDAMASLCDVNAVMGEDLDDLLYRLNRGKAAAHLAAKVRRTARVLQSQAEAQKSRLRAQMGTFSATSTAIAPSASAALSQTSTATSDVTMDDVSVPIQPEHLLTSLGILSDYLDDSWTEEVAAALG